MPEVRHSLPAPSAVATTHVRASLWRIGNEFEFLRRVPWDGSG